MTAAEFLATTLDPGLQFLSATVGQKPPNSDAVRVLMTAIAGQESGWDNVQQGGDGPGRGFFQMEPPTCGLILRNPTSSGMAAKICAALKTAATQEVVYAGLLIDPAGMAVSFARLDLWCDPHPLPALGHEQGAWDYYLRCWGPGKPGPDRWPANYEAAMAAVTGATTS